MANEPAAPAIWENWATRTTAILAVLAALSSGQWGASNLRAILEQGKVNDQWSYYQAKSIKGHIAEDAAELAAALAAGEAPGKDGALAKLATKRAGERDRVIAEKKQEESKAHDFERARDNFVERSFWFEVAFASMQVGVVLCTVASAAKKRSLWIISILCGFLGLALVANGFLRILKTPEYARTLAIKLEPEAGSRPGEAPPAPENPGPK
jgi:hypothetical protein